MCDALMELFKDELEESRRQGMEQGIEQGIEQAMEQIIRNALRNGHTPEQISDFNGISLEEVLAVQLAMTVEGQNVLIG